DVRIHLTLDRVLVEGARGLVAGSDGKQLYTHSGFQFPCRRDFLLPAVRVFGCPGVAAGHPVEVGCTPTHPVGRAGPWEGLLTSQERGRYPQIDRVIPALTERTTRWQIDPEEAAMLLRELPGRSQRRGEPVRLRIALGEPTLIRIEEGDFEGSGEWTVGR